MVYMLFSIFCSAYFSVYTTPIVISSKCTLQYIIIHEVIHNSIVGHDAFQDFYEKWNLWNLGAIVSFN